eukprot:8577688-Pyramimonas_sp.AAC.1
MAMDVDALDLAEQQRHQLEPQSKQTTLDELRRLRTVMREPTLFRFPAQGPDPFNSHGLAFERSAQGRNNFEHILHDML